jgi:hypothetical protein
MYRVRRALNNAKEFFSNPILYTPLPFVILSVPFWLADNLAKPVLSEKVVSQDQGQAYRETQTALRELSRDQAAVNQLPSLNVLENGVAGRAFLSVAQKVELKERIAQHLIFNPHLSEKQAYDLTVAFNKIDHDNMLNNAFAKDPAHLEDAMRWRDECRLSYSNNLEQIGAVTACMEEKGALSVKETEAWEGKLFIGVFFLSLVSTVGVAVTGDMDRQRKKPKPN